MIDLLLLTGAVLSAALSWYAFRYARTGRLPWEAT